MNISVLVVASKMEISQAQGYFCSFWAKIEVLQWGRDILIKSQQHFMIFPGTSRFHQVIPKLFIIKNHIFWKTQLLIMITAFLQWSKILNQRSFSSRTRIPSFNCLKSTSLQTAGIKFPEKECFSPMFRQYSGWFWNRIVIMPSNTFHRISIAYFIRIMNSFKLYN